MYVQVISEPGYTYLRMCVYVCVTVCVCVFLVPSYLRNYFKRKIPVISLPMFYFYCMEFNTMSISVLFLVLFLCFNLFYKSLLLSHGYQKEYL